MKKKFKMKEIREMSDVEIAGTLGDLNKELFNLRVQGRTGQLQNNARVPTIRKTIARMQTEMTARARSGQASKPQPTE